MSFTLFGWFLVNLIIILGLYSLCKSHEYVQHRSKWSIPSSAEFEYKKKRFCSVPLWLLVLFALAFTFALTINAYTVYAGFAVIGLYAFFIRF